jgi:hypothetical protein
MPKSSLVRIGGAIAGRTKSKVTLRRYGVLEMKTIAWLCDFSEMLISGVEKALKILFWSALILIGIVIFIVALIECPPLSPVGLLWLYVLFFVEHKK